MHSQRISRLFLDFQLRQDISMLMLMLRLARLMDSFNPYPMHHLDGVLV